MAYLIALVILGYWIPTRIGRGTGKPLTPKARWIFFAAWMGFWLFGYYVSFVTRFPNFPN
jgi:hypothetical protein